jgi:hypothetical protein
VKLLISVLVLSVTAAACSASGDARTIELGTLNESGVTGTVTLTDVGGGLTRVDVSVAANGNNDMPAHIHPGSCAELVPQPKHPLDNVISGMSTTVVEAPMDELMAGNLAVNLHRSVDDLGTYTACADLR